MNDLVALLGLAQPQVSKHLRVLREVGLVEVRDEGRQRLYRLNGQPLKPIHDWVQSYEQAGRSGSTGWTSCWRNSSEEEDDEMAVTSSRTAVVTLPTDTQILITREFDAPKHLVYRAWTTPELIKRWWSGDRGEVTSADVDLRVGGAWRYVMTAQRRLRGGLPRRVPRDRPERAASSHRDLRGAAGRAPRSPVTFTEQDGRTTLTMLVAAHEPGARDMHSTRAWRAACRTRCGCWRRSPPGSSEPGTHDRGR